LEYSGILYFQHGIFILINYVYMFLSIVVVPLYIPILWFWVFLSVAFASQNSLILLRLLGGGGYGVWTLEVIFHWILFYFILGLSRNNKFKLIFFGLKFLGFKGLHIQHPPTRVFFLQFLWSWHFGKKIQEICWISQIYIKRKFSKKFKLLLKKTHLGEKSTCTYHCIIHWKPIMT
jgi:hypothetical protein